jgi:phosphoglycolate phosphatase
VTAGVDVPILFDLDGTLTDNRVGITRSVQVALAGVGVHREPDELLAWIGPPLQDSFVALGGLGEATALRAVEVYRARFAEVGLYENAVYDGIEGALAELGSRRRLAVATSKPTVFAERILDHFGLADAFDVVVGAELDGSRRHKPEIIGHVLGRLGVGRAVMVGDREHDVAGAAACGIPCCGVLWGFGTEAELVAAGAATLVPTVGELAAAVESAGA